MTHQYKRNPRLDACFEPTPACFHEALLNATSNLSPAQSGRTSARRALLIAALIVLALGTAAFAAANRFGIFDFLAERGQTFGARAPELVETGLAEPVTTGGITFELNEAIYDGERLYVTVRMHSLDYPVVNAMDWEPEDLGVPQMLGGSSLKSIDGQPVNGYTGSGRNEDGAAYEILITEYPGATEAIDVELGLFAFDVNDERSGDAVMRFTVPVSNELNETVSHFEPIEMNGFTLTELTLNYTPLGLSVRGTYAIDPALDRYERLRREYMTVKLYDENGLEIRGDSNPIENPEAFSSAWEASDEPHRVLTIAFVGNDTEEYGRYTFDVKEGTP